MLRIYILLFFFSSFLLANIGTITQLEGKATILRDNQTLEIALNDKIEKKDVISTEINSKVKITFIDNTIITIGKSSSLSIEEYMFDSANKQANQTELNVVKGAFHTVTGMIGKMNPQRFKLKTKTATIGIRGTEFYGDENRIACVEGKIFVLSNKVSVDVPAGYYVDLFPNEQPSSPQPIKSGILNKIYERLNVGKLNDNIDMDTFNNSSSLIPKQEYVDNMNSWGYWDTNLEELKNKINNAKIDEKVTTAANNINQNPDPAPVPDPVIPDPVIPDPIIGNITLSYSTTDGIITLLAVVDEAPKTNLVLTLSEGQTITIPAGSTVGSFSFQIPYDYVSAPVLVSVVSSTGGGYDELNFGNTISIVTSALDVLTNIDYIMAQVNAATLQSLAYSGSFFGDNISTTALDNFINLNFDIGGGNNELTGSYEFTNTNGVIKAQDFNSLNAISTTNGSFSAKDSSLNRITGQFYGQTMDRVKGELHEDDTYQFKATK